MNDPFNLNYIKPNTDDIFKNLPKQTKPKQAAGGLYANLEDIMKEQNPTKKRQWEAVTQFTSELIH